MYTTNTFLVKKQLRLLFVGITCFTLAFAGCLTIDEMAPPVGPKFSRIEDRGVKLAVLKQGREVYLTDCTRCHSVERIDRYSIDHWHAIIERMGPQSKLDDSRTAALKAYIFAAHSVLSLDILYE